MRDSDLQEAATIVLRRAEKQGHVVQQEIREALVQAGQPESRWRELVNLVRDSLQLRQGRYYFVSAAGPKLQHEHQQLEEVHQVLRSFVDRRSQGTDPDRRKEERVPFGQSVPMRTENGEESTVLCQDVSLSGIRFVTNRGLIGQKVFVDLPPNGDDSKPVRFAVRVLWTVSVGEGLFENGGNFLEVIKDGQS